MNITLNQIFNNLKINHIDFSCDLSKDYNINCLNTLDKAENKFISFFHNTKYINQLKETKASFCFSTQALSKG